MAWQVGEAQTVPLVCYLDGVPEAPTGDPITTEVNVEGAGFVAATNAATDEGNGAVSVVLEANEVGAWGFVRVVGDNGAEGVQPYTAEEDWTKSRASFLDIIPDIDPGGAYRLRERYLDSDGNAVSDLKITVQGDVAGSPDGAVIGARSTDSEGYVVFHLDSGDYHLLSPTTAIWQASDTTVTIASTNIDSEITVTSLAIPASSDPSLCTCYLDVRYAETGVLVGAGEATMTLEAIESPEFPEASPGEATYAVNGADRGSTASGRISVELPRGSRIRARITSGNSKAIRRFTVPDAASAHLGSVLI